MSRKILGLVPARGGSKGIPRKNVRPIAGRPLIAWTIGAALGAERLSRVVVSSEDEEILAVARAWGADAPFVRPAELARDETPGIAPALHALDALAESYEWLVLLQPTSPLRTSGDIDAAIALCLEGEADACIGVTESAESPWWMFARSPSGELTPFGGREKIAPRRQELPRLYSVNGAIYVARVEALRRKRSFFMPGALGYVMARDHAVDIDDELDFALAQLLLEKRLARERG